MDQASQMIVIYTTFAQEQDARRLGALLIEKKLAACVNILPTIASMYRWQGRVEEASETTMLVKTRRELQDEALVVLRENHPYSVPALFVLEPSFVAAPYLQWLVAETQP